MKILFLTEYFDPEPAFIPSHELIRFFESQGHEVEVLTGFPNYPTGHFYEGTKIRPWRREIVNGIRVNRVIHYPSHDRSSLRRIISYGSFALSATFLGSFLIGKVDVVYIYHTPPTVALPAVIWKRFRNVPFVLQAQDLWPESVTESGMVGNGLVERIFAHGILRWCAIVDKRAASIVTISDGFRERLIERGVDAAKTSVIFNWTDETKFVPVRADPQLADELGFSGRVNVVYSGNLGHYQSLDIAIEAASRLVDIPEFQLVIIGSGVAEVELAEMITARGITNVRMAGHRPIAEMARINAISDALLISLQDVPFFALTIPSKTQVAMACGRPIIMVARGDAANLVGKAKAGLVCAPSDVDALESTFRTFCQLSGDERAAFGEHGREYYERELSLGRGGRLLLDLLEAAVG